MPDKGRLTLNTFNNSLPFCSDGYPGSFVVWHPTLEHSEKKKWSIVRFTLFKDSILYTDKVILFFKKNEIDFLFKDISIFWAASPEDPRIKTERLKVLKQVLKFDCNGEKIFLIEDSFHII